MKWVPALAALLTLTSAIAVAVGAGLAWLPAGLIVGGCEGFVAAYAAMYVWVKQSGQGSRGRS